MINEHPIKEKNKGRWLIIILVILVVCMVCTAITGALAIGIIRYSGGDGFSLPWKKPELDDPQGDVMMLVATSNGLTAYIFNADIDPPTLPSGIYYAEIKTVDDTTWACSQLSVLDEGTGFGHIDLANQDCTPLKGESDDIENPGALPDQCRPAQTDLSGHRF